MKKSEFGFNVIVMAIYFMIYMMMIVNQNTLGLDLISPIGTFFSSILMIHVYKKDKVRNQIWIFLALSAFVWTIVDVIWFIFDLLKMSPEGMIFFQLGYLVPSVMFVILGLFYMVRFVKGLNSVQLIIDIITVSFTCFVMFWFIILRGNIVSFLTSSDHIILFLYSICDFIIIILISIWFMSIRKGKNSRGILLTFFGIYFYGVIDILYNYVDFYKIDRPDTLLDMSYVVAFCAIALGGVLSVKDKNSIEIQKAGEKIQNMGRKGNDIFLLLSIPTYMLFRGHDAKIILLLIAIFVVYKTVSSYVQNAIRNEDLLKKEISMNKILEDKVNERTKMILQKNKELKYFAEHDFVTNLHNARFLKSYLDNLILEKKEKQKIVIFYIDVDRFKTINDMYGHDVGDKILIELSTRFMVICEGRGVAARIGGDEFVLACNHKLQKEEITEVAIRLIETCSYPVNIDNYEFSLAISIGIAEYPSDATTRETLLKNADMAMYESKMNGGNRFSFFNARLSEITMEKHQIEMALKRADYEKEFHVLYQPQIDLTTNEMIGMEALLRWDSPVIGGISPNIFIKIAEEIGSITKINEFVMKMASLQIGIWNRTYHKDLKMGINVSPIQLYHKDFLDKINEIRKTYDLKSEWIDIEITENIAMKGETSLEEIFTMLSNMGISTSIDDFGTGYSSLSYIQQFSFDRIKIAKELVDDITRDVNKKYIVKAIITMAEALNVITIAEGIETKEQLEMIRELGCKQVQGFYYSKPITAEELEERYLK